MMGHQGEQGGRGGGRGGGRETREEGREQPSVGPREQMGTCSLAAPRGTDRDSPEEHLLPPLRRGQEGVNVSHAAQHVALSGLLQGNTLELASPGAWAAGAFSPAPPGPAGAASPAVGYPVSSLRAWMSEPPGDGSTCRAGAWPHSVCPVSRIISPPSSVPAAPWCHCPAGPLLTESSSEARTLHPRAPLPSRPWPSTGTPHPPSGTSWSLSTPLTGPDNWAAPRGTLQRLS